MVVPVGVAAYKITVDALSYFRPRNATVGFYFFGATDYSCMKSHIDYLTNKYNILLTIKAATCSPKKHL